ncbi:carboxymuconolactone decarboxylase family protein [Natrarchaeobius sp. A-rgal3]|uniref:carboxymuconolactone decarboxylase family protein n=1 Tax=Natrarchaeobius versutus TaxID=1679078 RepID=UPI00350F0872
MARVPYVEQEDLDPEYRELIISSLQPGKRANVYSAVGNNQEVLDGLRTFLGSLWTHSGLTDRQREIVILTAASEIANDYEWHQHVIIGTDAGLSENEIAAIGRDDRADFDDDERALVAYSRAVVCGRVNDSVHEAAVDHFGEETAVGAAATAAGYLALGRVIDALGVDLEGDDEFVGWDLENRE